VLETWDDVGHFLHVEAPERTARATLDFLAAHA
jgi:pimeloyl-ACP methyl ester carboxylesterase